MTSVHEIKDRLLRVIDKDGSVSLIFLFHILMSGFSIFGVEVYN